MNETDRSESETIKRIRAISVRTGDVFTPTIVSDESSWAPRSVCVMEGEGPTVIEISASGDCLAALKKSIRKIVPDCVFVDETEVEDAAGDEDETNDDEDAES